MDLRSETQHIGVLHTTGLTWDCRELVLPTLVHSSLPEGPGSKKAVQCLADTAQGCDDEASVEEDTHVEDDLRRQHV